MNSGGEKDVTFLWGSFSLFNHLIWERETKKKEKEKKEKEEKKKKKGK